MTSGVRVISLIGKSCTDSSRAAVRCVSGSKALINSNVSPKKSSLIGSPPGG